MLHRHLGLFQGPLRPPRRAVPAASQAPLMSRSLGWRTAYKQPASRSRTPGACRGPTVPQPASPPGFGYRSTRIGNGPPAMRSSLPLLECCFGTSPIQAEKSRSDRKAFGSTTLATRAVASAGPTPGISSSRLLVSLDRCQTVIIRSNSRICALSIRSYQLRPTGATIPNSARWARIAGSPRSAGG